MKNRIFSLLSAGCILLSSAPAMAGAEEGSLLSGETSSKTPAVQARYQAEADGEWLTGTLAEALSGVYKGGRVEILEDLLLEEPLTVEKPLTLASAEVSAPCTLRYTTENLADWLLTVRADATLEDIILDGRREEGLTSQTELVGVQNGAALTLGSGAVLQNNDNASTAKAGGGLRITAGCTVIMQAGSVIRGCRGYAGGGVSVASGGDPPATLVLNGGCIEECEAVLGGGIMMESTRGGGVVRVYDGSAIQNNRAVEDLGRPMYIGAFRPLGSGGGIYVEKGRVYLLGGEAGGAVTGNSAEGSGGGIYLDGIDTVGSVLLQLANGSVTGNVAGSYGGGIASSLFPSIVVGNGPQVTGNTGGKRHEGVFDNVYLDGAEDYNYLPTRPMIIGAPLWDKTFIGISRWLRPDEDHPYRVVATPNTGYTITENDLAKFESDDPTYVVLLHEGDIVLANAHVVFDNQGHGKRPKSQRLAENHKAVEPEPLTERGYDFGGWYREAGCETAWDFETDTVTEYDEAPLILYARWDLIPYPITYDLDGGENAKENPDSYTVESETITLRPPTKEGYTFLGWSEEPAQVQTAPTIPHGSIGERSFTAQWKKKPEPTPKPTPDDEDDDPPPKPKPSPTATPTPSPTPIPIHSPTATPMPTESPLPTQTAAPSPTPEPTPASSAFPEETPAPTPEAVPSISPEPVPEPTPNPTPTPDHIPQMGDPTHSLLWAGLAAASLGGMAMILLLCSPTRRRRR